MGICPFWQWLFRKTGTMGTLASQAEIDVWVQAPGRFYGAGGQGISLRKNCWYCISNILQFSVFLARKSSQCRL